MPTPSRDSQRGGQSWGPLLGLCVTAPANAPSHAPPFSHQPASRLAISSKPLRPSPSSPNNKDSLVKHLETSSGLKKKKKISFHHLYLTKFKKKGNSTLPKSGPSKYKRLPRCMATFNTLSHPRPCSFTSCPPHRNFCLSHFLLDPGLALTFSIIHLVFRCL